jgi:hypothetical protein
MHHSYALTRKASLPASAEAKEVSSKKEANIVIICFEIAVAAFALFVIVRRFENPHYNRSYETLLRLHGV